MLFSLVNVNTPPTYSYPTLVSNLFVRPIRFFLNLNFYFMKTANIIPVYGNITMYGKDCVVCLKIDYTDAKNTFVQYLHLHLRTRSLYNSEDTGKCTL